MRGFIVRLVGYAVLLGVSSRVAQTLWDDNGLNEVAMLQPFHHDGIVVLVVAPVVLALIGIGRLRALAVFVAFCLAGAAVTAPFVCARAVGV